MKNRDYKKLGIGNFVHIYNRGNNKEKIFHDQNDYKAFLFRLGLSLGISEQILKKDNLLSIKNSRIRINANANLFTLHSFCLMPNHFHLLIEQKSDIPVSKLILQLSTSYAMYVNKKYGRVGHVFQDTFKSVLIENDSQLMWTSAYIHMNPVKSGLAKMPEDYVWSSYSDYIGNRNLPMVHTDFLVSIFGKDNFSKETLALSRDE